MTKIQTETIEGQPLLVADHIYTQHAVAKFLDRSERTLMLWRGKGSGPPFRRIRNRIIYIGRDVNTWVLDQSKVNAPSVPARRGAAS